MASREPQYTVNPAAWIWHKKTPRSRKTATKCGRTSFITQETKPLNETDPSQRCNKCWG